MADNIEYPQRWLKEHGAIKSPEGWRRATNQELLKCQKGLEDDVHVIPTIKTVSTSGVPTNLVLTGGNATFIFHYSFTDSAYFPTSVTCTSTSDGSAVVTNTKQSDNSFKVDISGGTPEEKVTVKVTIDTVSSTNRTTTLKSA